MHEKNLNNLFEDVIKKLKKSNSIQKTVKVNDNTIVNGPLSPFDSVSFIELTTFLEEEIEKLNKKSFHIILNEIPQFKKGLGTIKIKDLKKYILKKNKK
tara:strand:- start:375 stop:671 length:297 start_codon:yes stop_codon:yes gene_type:complete